jgi:hypothetical protein
MKVTIRDVHARSRSELDDIFRGSPAGPIPTGRAQGTALLFPGTAADRLLRKLIRALVWQGKVFRPETRDLKNRIGPVGIPLIRAQVYEDESWFSPGPAIIIDYSRSSIIARFIRDEIREVEPGFYLGQVFLGRRRIAHFTLQCATTEEQ